MLVTSAIQNVFLGDLFHCTARLTYRVLLPLIVFRNHEDWNPWLSPSNFTVESDGEGNFVCLETAFEGENGEKERVKEDKGEESSTKESSCEGGVEGETYHIDFDTLLGAVRGLYMDNLGHHVTGVEGVTGIHSLHDHTDVAIAFAKSLRRFSTLTVKGFFFFLFLFCWFFLFFFSSSQKLDFFFSFFFLSSFSGSLNLNELFSGSEGKDDNVHLYIDPNSLFFELTHTHDLLTHSLFAYSTSNTFSSKKKLANIHKIFEKSGEKKIASSARVLPVFIFSVSGWGERERERDRWGGKNKEKMVGGDGFGFGERGEPFAASSDAVVVIQTPNEKVSFFFFKKNSFLFCFPLFFLNFELNLFFSFLFSPPFSFFPHSPSGKHTPLLSKNASQTISETCHSSYFRRNSLFTRKYSPSNNPFFSNQTAPRARLSLESRTSPFWPFCFFCDACG